MSNPSLAEYDRALSMILISLENLFTKFPL